MGCQDYSSAYCGDTLSSNCVKWEGPNIACLGITTGMSITQVEQAIATQLCDLNNQNPADALLTTTLCGDFVTLMAGKSKNIANILQVLIDYGCTLKDILVLVDIRLKALENLVIDFKCLRKSSSSGGTDPCGPDPNDPGLTLQDILQLIVNAICDLQMQVNGILSSLQSIIDISINTALANRIRSCQPNRVTTQGTGANLNVFIRGLVPPFTPLAYFGSLSYFDGDGKGMDGTPVCGYYLCNGKFGTPDMRGVVPLGATNIPGGALAAFSDPSTYGLPALSIGDSGGMHKVLLSGSECGIANHNHGGSTTVNVTVGFEYETPNRTNGGGDLSPGVEYDGGWATNHNLGPIHKTGTAAGSATMQIPGSGDIPASVSHENRMPFRACAWICMIN